MYTHLEYSCVSEGICFNDPNCLISGYLFCLLHCSQHMFAKFSDLKLIRTPASPYAGVAGDPDHTIIVQ